MIFNNKSTSSNNLYFCVGIFFGYASIINAQIVPDKISTDEEAALCRYEHKAELEDCPNEYVKCMNSCPFLLCIGSYSSNCSRQRDNCLAKKPACNIGDKKPNSWKEGVRGLPYPAVISTNEEAKLCKFEASEGTQACAKELKKCEFSCKNPLAKIPGLSFGCDIKGCYNQETDCLLKIWGGCEKGDKKPPKWKGIGTVTLSPAETIPTEDKAKICRLEFENGLKTCKDEYMKCMDSCTALVSCQTGYKQNCINQMFRCKAKLHPSCNMGDPIPDSWKAK